MRQILGERVKKKSELLICSVIFPIKFVAYTIV
jgi:hypothetical protein